MDHSHKIDNALVCMADEDGRIIGASPSYISWLGRDKEGVVDHLWKEWVHPSDFESSWQLARTALVENRQTTWSRKVLQPDGAIICGQITVQPYILSTGNRSLIGTTRSLLLNKSSNSDTLDFAKEVALYVEDMSQQLAIMSQECGLFSLSDILEQAVAEAEKSAARLNDIAF